jgi:hypothetical protein
MKLAKCESCGRKLRSDEGRICLICAGRILKQLEALKVLRKLKGGKQSA